MDGPLKPIKFLQGKTIQTGYDATALPLICDIWLKARDAGALQKQQLGKAKRAEIPLAEYRELGQIGMNVGALPRFQFQLRGRTR